MAQLSKEDMDLHSAGQREVLAAAVMMAHFDMSNPTTVNSFDSAMGGIDSAVEGEVLPPALVDIFDAVGVENKGLVLQGLRQGIDLYARYNGGDTPSNHVVASALASTASLLSKNDNGNFTHFDSLTHDHAESLSVVANIAMVTIASSIGNSLSIFTPIPNPRGSKKVPLIYVRMLADQHNGALTKTDYLDGEKASQTYVDPRRKFLMANTSGTTYAVASHIAYLPNSQDPDTTSLAAPFVAGRVSIQVNGIEVAHDRIEGLKNKAGSNTLQAVNDVVIGGVPVKVSTGTSNLDTHTNTVTFLAALPVGAKVRAVVNLDYERKDSSSKFMLTPPGAEVGIETASLLADSIMYQVTATIDAQTQMVNELGLQYKPAALAQLQGKFMLERNMRLLSDAKERAEENGRTAEFDANRGTIDGAVQAFNPTAGLMAEFIKVLQYAALKINKAVGQSASGYELYTTDRGATLINQMAGDSFDTTGTPFGFNTAITRVGTLRGGINVYCVPESYGMFLESADASQALLVARSAEPTKNIFVGFDVVPMTLREAKPDAREDVLAMFGVNCADLNPLKRFSDQACLIDLVNMPLLGD